MAVKDFLGRETDAFVLPSKSYYPLKIPIAHYQLRHFISSPEQDLLYYASGADVYCLNTVTKTQAHVTTLPWEARCTAAGYGYVCVGGAEEGNFAAVKVAGFPPADPADVDALLPLDLASRTPLPRPPQLGAAHRTRLEKIGEDIVNSISIHKLEAEGDGEDEVVAVLTNNDKTVRIFSLTQNLEVAVLYLPFPMNHATISPDGQLLVAVGDMHRGFFFERVKTQKPSMMKTPEGRPQSVPPEWSLFDDVCLYVPSGSAIEGYFTTAWSPSGRLCAVGSECGYITVFDVEVMTKTRYAEDAVVEVIQSTRPDTLAGPGAVRTMQFSPSPFDLLVWSEDQAKVCVADLRSGLKVKQVLNLDPREEGLEKTAIADFDVQLDPQLQDLRREADFIRRYRRALDSEGSAAAINFATDYIEESSERRRQRQQLGVVESDNDPHGLTAHERQILETLRTTRQRDEAREPRPSMLTPRSINYTSRTPDEVRRAAMAFDALEHTTALATDRNSAYRRAIDGLSNASSPFGELTRESSRLLDQLRQLEERASPALGPRRQASIVLVNDTGAGTAATTAFTSDSGRITDSVVTRSPNPIPAHARRADPQIISNTDDAWRTIEEALHRNARATETARNSGAPAELRGEYRRLRQLTQARERLRSAREAQSSLYEHSYRRASRQAQPDPSSGVRTAGLAMSQDGRKLYCGTEEGIFEFDINLHERKGIPAISPR